MEKTYKNIFAIQYSQCIRCGGCQEPHFTYEETRIGTLPVPVAQPTDAKIDIQALEAIVRACPTNAIHIMESHPAVERAKKTHR